MAYAHSKNIEVNQIPVIDVAPLHSGTTEAVRSVAIEIRWAAEEVGFFYIRNHGISESVIEQAYLAAVGFFSRPREWKDCVKINENHHGFLSVGEAKMEQAERVDLKESFVWGLDLPDDHPSVTAENPFLGRNRWPDEMPELQEGVYPFFEEGLQCGRNMMRAFALGMDLPEDSFLKTTDEPIARSSIIYYPPQPRAIIELVDPDDPTRKVDYGETGQVMLTTLTREFFMPRFLERDEAERAEPIDRYPWDGVENLRLLTQLHESVVVGVY